MRAAALIILALAASSCAGSTQPPHGAGAAAEARQAPMTDPSQPDVEVATYRSNGITAAARLVGTLAVVDGCIMITSASYPDGILVFFPEGQARWNGGDRTLTIGMDRFRLGDRISLSGGSSSVSAYGGRANMPRGCARSGGFFSGARGMIVD